MCLDNFEPVTSPPDRSCCSPLFHSRSGLLWSHSCSDWQWSNSRIPFPCFLSLHHRSDYSWSTGTRQTRLKTTMKEFLIFKISTWARWICQALLQLKVSPAGQALPPWPAAVQARPRLLHTNIAMSLDILALRMWVRSNMCNW